MLGRVVSSCLTWDFAEIVHLSTTKCNALVSLQLFYNPTTVRDKVELYKYETHFHPGKQI